MKILDEVVARALVGSQRQAGALPRLPEDLDGLTDPAAPFEKALLDSAAACVVYATCGFTTTPAADHPAACPSDVTTECSPKAAQMLAQLLHTNLDSVLTEWLHAAANARRRPPHALLPILLDRAATRHELRDIVHRVIDHCGTWLAGLNPQWQFAKPTPADSEAAWQTGARDERLTALRMVRESDPVAGGSLFRTLGLSIRPTTGSDGSARWRTTCRWTTNRFSNPASTTAAAAFGKRRPNCWPDCRPRDLLPG